MLKIAPAKNVPRGFALILGDAVHNLACAFARSGRRQLREGFEPDGCYEIRDRDLGLHSLKELLKAYFECLGDFLQSPDTYLFVSVFKF